MIKKKNLFLPKCASNIMSTRKKLIDELVSEGALRNEKVRRAFERVDRAAFVPKNQKRWAYANYPLELEEGQTISQPLTVAIMTEALDAREGQKILEIGTGSGYQAAILSELAGDKGKVVTTEVRASLFDFAKINLKKYRNVIVIHADGSKGCEEYAPYDRIIVTASATKIPPKLVEQLKDNGIMIIPVGDEMYKIEKRKNAIKKTFMGYFAFVPMKE